VQELHREKLRRELGPEVLGWLGDPNVIEIMANPDGCVWLDTLAEGLVDTGLVLSSTQIDLAIGTVAAYYGRVVNEESPRLQAELPLGGQRFQGVRPPISSPLFVIRKHLPRVFSMAELVAQGTVTETQAEVLLTALQEEQNIIIAGATLSGKTVLLDTLLSEMPRLLGEQLRLIVIEDTHELHVAVRNRVTLRASDTEPMRVLVHAAMRMRPDRLIIGEVRGAEALEMLKAWNTGHGGSACTVHASSAAQALRRLKTTVQEAGVPADPELIGEVVDLLVMMKRRGSRQWGVEEIVACHRWHEGQYDLETIALSPHAGISVNGAQRTGEASCLSD
jgi:type IV secretion system protein VirB11